MSTLMPIMLKLTPDGDLYNAMSNQLVCHMVPGELVRINAGGEYNIIVHRNPTNTPGAKPDARRGQILKLVR